MIFVRFWLVVLALIATPLLAQAPPASDPGASRIKDIVIEGIRRVPAPAILNRVQTKIGDPLAAAALRDDVRSIFALGFFDDVQVRTEEFEGGVRVIFVVDERPLLREVIFEGNTELKTDELRWTADMRVSTLYDPVAVQKAEEAIRQKYEDEGFFGFTISARTERTPEGNRVVFQIDEGRKTIDRILIERLAGLAPQIDSPDDPSVLRVRVPLGPQGIHGAYSMLDRGALASCLRHPPRRHPGVRRDGESGLHVQRPRRAEPVARRLARESRGDQRRPVWVRV